LERENVSGTENEVKEKYEGPMEQIKGGKKAAYRVKIRSWM
jgi:hypothetical protein